MAVVFPELKTFFTGSVSTTAPVRLIAVYPTPAELADAPNEEVRSVLWEAGAYRHAKRVDELQALARNSSGLLPDPQRAWRLGWVTDFLLANFKAQMALEKQVETLVTQREDYHWIADVPYSGPATLGMILGATGDVHRFRNYRQYIAYTGYFAGLETSQTIDRTRMSRRGNRDLKRALFQIAAPLVWFDRGENPYKALFERKEAEGQPWYSAMPYVCAALARHIYHCLKFQEPYNVVKAFGEPVSSRAFEQAIEDLRADLEDQFEVMEAHRSCSLTASYPRRGVKAPLRTRWSGPGVSVTLVLMLYDGKEGEPAKGHAPAAQLGADGLLKILRVKDESF